MIQSPSPFLTQDAQGYIYWKGRQVEHYSYTYGESEAERNATVELVRRCERLESLGVRVTGSTVVWAWSWFESIDSTNPYLALLGRMPDLYEKPGEGLGFYIEEKSDETSGSGSFYYWTGSGWGKLSVAWELPDVMYHTMERLGWGIPQVGQGKHNGLCYATTEQVTDLLKRWNFPVEGWPGLGA